MMKSLQGQILVAAPSFVGAPLPRAVVLITEHTADQATGVVLNHPLNEQILRSCLQMWQAGKSPAVALKMVQTQIPGLPELSEPHTAGEEFVPQPEKEVADERCQKKEHCGERSESPNELEVPATAPLNVGENLPAGIIPQTVQIPVGVLVAPNNVFGGRLSDKVPPMFRVVVGQVGWKSGDIDAQLAHGHWLTTSATPELLFAAHEDLWKFAVQRVGLDVLQNSLGIVPAVPTEMN